MPLRLLIADCDPELADALAVAFAALPDAVLLRATDEALIEAVEATSPDLVVVGAASAAALLHRCRAVECELAAARIALGERLALDQAKALLVSRRGLSEPEAHRWLQRRAMNEGRRVADVVRDLVDGEK